MTFSPVKTLVFVGTLAAFVSAQYGRCISNYRCQNGGSCQLNNWRRVCNCRTGFTGSRCQKRTNPPKKSLVAPCPPSEPGLCQEECKVDSDCGVNEKCCLGSCGYKQCYEPQIDCQWSEWSACERMGLNPRSCGEGAGKRTRIRNLECTFAGETIYSEEQCFIPCPTCESKWSEWSGCRAFASNEFCGPRAGKRKRTKDPNCLKSWEKAEEERRCDLLPCPPCPFENWGPWGPCSLSCGPAGYRTRSTEPIRLSKHCTVNQAELIQREACSGLDCRNCEWSSWSSCRKISNFCGNNAGHQTRTRDRKCGSWGSQNKEEYRFCHISCPCDPTWTHWSSCKPKGPQKTCGRGAGHKTRSKSCGNSINNEEEKRICDLTPCMPCPMKSWETWGPCSVSCGSGQRKRTRRVWKIDDNCDDGRPETESENCWNSQCPNLDCVDEFRQCAKQGNQVCTVSGCYQGRKSATLSGRTCQRWNSQNPQQHSYSSVGNHNRCRNPSNDTAPWCYTTDPDLRWDYCFPDCDPTPCRDKDSPAACADAVAREMCLPCHRNFYKTIVNCCLSCKKSQNPNVEQLADDRCARWAKGGRCSNSIQVQHNCSHLCRIC